VRPGVGHELDIFDTRDVVLLRHLSLRTPQERTAGDSGRHPRRSAAL
jgi:hypothetical protein